MRIVFDLIFLISTLVGAGYVAREALCKMQELTFKRIDKGFSSTSKLNDQLWGRTNSEQHTTNNKEANGQKTKR